MLAAETRKEVRVKTFTATSARLAAFVAALGCATQTATLRPPGTEARRVALLSWPKPHITRVLGTNRSELGLNGSKAPEQMMTIAGKSCVFGDLLAFDVGDR